MIELITFLEEELGKEIDHAKLEAYIITTGINVTTLMYDFRTMNRLAKGHLLTVYKNLDIWEVVL